MRYDWPITSLKREWWSINFIAFFETVLGREDSRKVSKKFIGNFYFWGITLRRFPNPSFSRGTQEIWVRREILSTNTLFILHIYKQPTAYISKIASQQAGGTCCLNREMPKKFMLSPVTERHTRVPFYSSAAVYNHYKPLFYDNSTNSRALIG